MASRKIPSITRPANPVLQVDQLLGDLRQMIEAARLRVATSANAEMTVLYWRIGRRIHSEILSGERAPYGESILAALSQHLVGEYGRGFTYTALTRMASFFGAFPDESIVATLSQQLSWSHFRELLPLKRPLQREYYAQMCRIERWSVRTLRERIDSMLYERTALSRKPEKLIERELDGLRDAERVTPDLLMRDPYMLDFLGLHDSYLEDDLEAAIVREMEAFLLELGAGFSFVARQKRIQLDGDDFYLDLLFYNRKLKRLIAIELKVGEFKAEYKGQMELYLRWLDKYEREPDELPPLGIILCTGKKSEQIELLEMDRSGIHVAEYLTALPSRKVLGEKLQLAAERAKRQLEHRVPRDDTGPQTDKNRSNVRDRANAGKRKP
jgi:predicted nuclease of restriction endonuclease-like (RecB) superfamily